MAPGHANQQEFVLNLDSYQLMRGEHSIRLEKLPMALLILLVRKQGNLVTRDEIVSGVWGNGVHIDVDAGINTAIRKIRHALGDNPAAPRYLETVVGKGYRLVGSIALVEKQTSPRAATTSAGPRRFEQGRILLWTIASVAA